MFCKHDWQVLSETVTKSKYEDSLQVSKGAGIIGKFDMPGQLCCADRKHIQVFACSKCGNLKRFVEEI